MRRDGGLPHGEPHSPPCTVCARPECGGEHALTNYEVKLRSDLDAARKERDKLRREVATDNANRSTQGEIARAAFRDIDEDREAMSWLAASFGCSLAEAVARHLTQERDAARKERDEARAKALRDAAEMVVRDAEVIFQGDRYELRDAILALKEKP